MDLSDPGIEPGSPALEADSLPAELSGKRMATHSSILAWKIPWTEEPGGLQSKGKNQTQLKRLSMHTYGKSLILL